MFEGPSRSVASTNGVQVAVYDEDGATQPSAAQPQPSILFSHATGFHGRVFSPVAAHLRGFSCTTFDYRGYGDTPAPADWPVSWEGFGDDALGVARDTHRRHNSRPLVAVGHSMGGAGVIMAALNDPTLFAALIVFEPIIFPPDVRARASGDNPLSEVTRRRRRTFGSFDEAITNFVSKPPLQSLHPAALDAYVRHGFAPSSDGVVIKCDPEFEARTYEMGVMHDTWQRLETLRVPTWVLAGKHVEYSPAAFAPRIAERIPAATFIEWPDRGHFGPLEDPQRFAGVVADIASSVRH